MAYIIGCALIALLASIWYEGLDANFNIPAVLSGAFAGCIAWLFIGSFVGIGLDTEPVYDKTIPICAMSDNYKSPTLISSTDSEIYYMEETENGKHIDSIPSDVAYFQEDELDNNPRIERYTSKIKNKHWYWYATPFTEWCYTYKVYVPKDSITHDYNIDLQN